MNDLHTLDLFAPTAIRPGSLGCRVEIAATLSAAMKRAVVRRTRLRPAHTGCKTPRGTRRAALH